MDRPQLECRAAAFGVAVVNLCQALHRDHPAARRLVAQLLDSATAVGANYRATSRARSRREFVAKMGVVAEEADEAVYWLEMLDRAAIGNRETVAALLQEATELRAIFAASYRTARSRGSRRGSSPDQ